MRGFKWLFSAILAFSIHFAYAHDIALVTWNVGEISDPHPKRIEHLIDRALSEQPDVLLLQEVEERTWKALTKSAQVVSGYRIGYQSSRSGLPHGGLVTLFRRDLKVDSPRYENLPSEMGRGLLILRIPICGEMLQVANVHLESPDILFWRSRSYRHEQVDRIRYLSNDGGDWIVAGDFNPVFESEADRWFSDDWNDAWMQLHPNDPGLTWDPDHNSMAWHQGGFVLPGFRLDRLVYRSSVLMPRHAQILGVGAEPPLSDHFGLRVAFSCSGG